MQYEKNVKEIILARIKRHFPKVYDIEIINNQYVKCFQKEEPTLFEPNLESEFYTSDLKYWLKENC